MRWKSHPIYVHYAISECGQVRNIKRKIIRKSRLDKDGYRRINIIFHGKHITCKISHLVAETFICNRITLTVNHDDGIKQNGHNTQIVWVSSSILPTK